MKRRVVSALVVAIALLAPVSVLAVVLGAWLQYVGNPVLPIGKKGAWDDKSVYSADVYWSDTGYRMWYAASGSEAAQSRIGYATSTDGFTWTKPVQDPVLTPGTGLSWDSEGVGAPSVLFDPGTNTWKMWYAGLSLGGAGYQIGLATSPDGIHWTKYVGNPVLSSSLSGWDDVNVVSPNVLYRDGTYHMWYAGRGDRLQIGYATSPDGISWTRSTQSPVLTIGSDLEWDNGEIASPSVLWVNNHYEMWYQGYNRTDKRTFIGHATSSNGIVWSKSVSNPVMSGQPLTWDAFSVYYPCVVQVDDQLMMWFHGEPSELAQKQIGVATWNESALPATILPIETPTNVTPVRGTPTQITVTPPTVTPTDDAHDANCIGDIPNCVFMPNVSNHP